MDDKQIHPDVIQNLKDAGCDEATISTYIDCCACQDDHHQMRLLKKHRRYLLDHIHEDQKRIDCLDYLIYQVEKKKKDKE